MGGTKRSFVTFENSIEVKFHCVVCLLKCCNTTEGSTALTPSPALQWELPAAGQEEGHLSRVCVERVRAHQHWVAGQDRKLVRCRGAAYVLGYSVLLSVYVSQIGLQ